MNRETRFCNWVIVEFSLTGSDMEKIFPPKQLFLTMKRRMVLHISNMLEFENMEDLQKINSKNYSKAIRQLENLTRENKDKLELMINMKLL